jgi:hypothetical protein
VGQQCQKVACKKGHFPFDLIQAICSNWQAGILEREFERIAYETAIGSWQANRSGAYSDTRGSAGPAPGIHYTLAMATNLSGPNWTARVTNSQAIGTFTDAKVPGFSNRFYCAVMVL